MNVRKKAILTVALLFSIALIAVVIVSQTIVLAGFETLEKNDTTTQTARATDALNQNIVGLDALVYNNAAWDDTYQFIQDNNTAYIVSCGYTDDQTFVSININLIAFLDCSGRVGYMRAYSNSTISSNSIVSNMQNMIPSESNLWNFSTTDSYTKGLMNVGGTLFLVASRPIIMSNFTGPVKGALLMGRILSPELIGSLEQQTHLQIEIANLMDNDLPTNFLEARSNLPNLDSVYIKPENSSVVVGYTLLADINQNQCAMLDVSLPRNIYSEGVGTITSFTYMLAFLFLVFGVATVLFLEETLVSRVLKLTSNVREITSAQKIDQRVALDDSRFGSKNDELSVLSTSINKMLDTIQEITGKLKKSERFSAIGELAVMVAHDLRNPLQGIKMAADFLSSEKASRPEDRTKMLDIVKKDIYYCEKIINDLLDYSKELKIAPLETDVPSILSASLNHIQVPENVEITILTAKEPKIHVDIDKMMRVFDNMLRNAIEAMPEGGNLMIKNEASEEIMRISFEDTGHGIPKDNLEKLFSPLYTTKAKGMGLGLVICKRIIDAHKGSISVESVVGEGTKFTIELPRQIQNNSLA